MKSRRTFIKQMGLASLGLMTPMTSIVNLRAMSSLLSNNPPFDDYKAIVYLFLHGGNDSYNMLLPRTEYNNYAETRTNLKILKNDILPLNGATGDFGVHPSLSKIQNIYNEGDLAFINNIGTLVAPMTKNEYNNKSVPRPLGLFSHLDQYNHWQTAQPNTRTNKGWAGKIADLIGNENNNTKLSMNLSLSGANILQRGNESIGFSINSSGAVLPSNRNVTWGNHPYRKAAMDSILNHNYSDIFKNTYTDIFKNSIETGENYQNTINDLPDFNTAFSDNNISANFKIIAKTISARNSLDFKRQIFFIRYGGWDHHDDLLSNHADKLKIVDSALNEFKNALQEIGIFNKVTTVVSSEFARTLTSNGNGTDHAWGGNTMVMGGNVNGGNMFGTYPSLEINSENYIGRGAMIPTTATDSLFSELALWYGVSPSDLPLLFPNLGNFHDLASISPTSPPIGFLNM